MSARVHVCVHERACTCVCVCVCVHEHERACTCVSVRGCLRVSMRWFLEAIVASLFTFTLILLSHAVCRNTITVR